MRFSAVKESILLYLQYANGFTSNKTLNPLLQNVYIETENGKLNLKTTNYQVGFQVSFDVTVEEPGATTVSCKKLLDIVRGLPDGSLINFNFDGSRLEVKSGNSNYKLATISPESFPTMSPIIEEYYIKVASKDIMTLLKRVWFCISNEHQKIEYTGAHFNIYGNCLEIYATGLQRVAIASMLFDVNFSDEFIVNIPKKTIVELMKVLEGSETVEIATDRRQMSFKVGNIIIYTKLIEKFVKGVARLFANDYPIKVKIDKKTLMEASRRVSNIADDETPGLSLLFDKSKLVLSSLETEYGLGSEILDNIDYNGEPFEICFHYRLLNEILSNIESDTITLEMSSNRSPALITPDSERYRYLIVPISIDKI